MKSKKKLLIAAILILAIVSIGSYAIYKSTATGTSGFKTAKWYIELNNQDITTNNTFTFDLKAADWTHNAIIDSDETELVVIAPGSYGTFGINIDASETEVDVEYTLTAVVKQNDTEVSLSTINPNLSIGFYENDELKDNPLTGSISAHGTYNGEIRIVWNAVDSTSANSNDININDQDFVVEVTVITKQKAKPVPASQSLLTNAASELTEIDDGIYIFSGTNPANYVSFNDESWRILGIYDGQLKIVRTTSEYKVWNSERTNNWEGSSLEQYLNSEETGGFIASLSQTAQNMLAPGTWYTGACSNRLASSGAYTCAKTSQVNNKKAGIMTSYEYLYAAETSCHTTSGYYYDSGCKNKDWLYPNKNTSTWTMTPYTVEPDIVLTINDNGYILSDYYVTYSYVMFPAVYLNSQVTITGGDGQSPETAYILELDE